MENRVEVPQKITNRTTLGSSKPTSGYIFKGIEISILKRYWHSHVHCSIIHSSQDMKHPKCPLMDGGTFSLGHKEQAGRGVVEDGCGCVEDPRGRSK